MGLRVYLLITSTYLTVTFHRVWGSTFSSQVHISLRRSIRHGVYLLIRSIYLTVTFQGPWGFWGLPPNHKYTSHCDVPLGMGSISSSQVYISYKHFKDLWGFGGLPPHHKYISHCDIPLGMGSISSLQVYI